MTRNAFRALVVTLCALALTVVAGGDAMAGKRKKKAKKKAAPTMSAEQEKALDGFMGAFKFGMTQKQVIGVVAKQIRERYAAKIADTNDTFAQDKLRRKRDKQIKRFKASATAFKGKKSGWDVSIIDDQFRHKTTEEMMVHWETHQGRDQRRFFFFFRGRLYKMFIALNTSSIAGAEEKGFDFFKELMEARFGPAANVEGRLEWQTKKVRAQAINKLGLYSAFCLVLADRSQERDLEAVRLANAPAAEKRNNIIEAIKDDGTEPDIGSNAHTIDNMVKNK